MSLESRGPEDSSWLAEREDGGRRPGLILQPVPLVRALHPALYGNPSAMQCAPGPWFAERDDGGSIRTGKPSVQGRVAILIRQLHVNARTTAYAGR